MTGEECGDDVLKMIENYDKAKLGEIGHFIVTNHSAKKINVYESQDSDEIN